MTDIVTFGVGNSTILNQDGKTKILSYVACFYSKCLAKIVFWRAASWLIRPFGSCCTVACPLINCSFFLRSKIFFYWSFFPNFFFCVIIKSKLTPGHNLTIVKFYSRFTRLELMLLDPQLTAIEHKMNMVLLKFAHGATSNAQHYLKMLCTMITKPPSKSKFYVDFKTIYIFSKITKLTRLLSSHVLRLIR